MAKYIDRRPPRHSRGLDGVNWPRQTALLPSFTPGPASDFFARGWIVSTLRHEALCSF